MNLYGWVYTHIHSYTLTYIYKRCRGIYHQTKHKLTHQCICFFLLLFLANETRLTVKVGIIYTHWNIRKKFRFQNQYPNERRRDRTRTKRIRAYYIQFQIERKYKLKN